MKETYNVLIYIGKEMDGLYRKRDREILIINYIFGDNYGFDKLDGEFFWDDMKLNWFNIRDIIHYNSGEKEGIEKKIELYKDRYKKGFRILSGSMEEIIGEIKEILLLMEVI